MTAISRFIHIVGTDRTDNAFPNSSSIVACVAVGADSINNTVFRAWCVPLVELCHCLTTDMLLEPFPSKGCLCWIYNSGLQQINHNIFKCKIYTGTQGKFVPLLAYSFGRQAMKTEGGNRSTVPPIWPWN